STCRYSAIDTGNGDTNQKEQGDIKGPFTVLDKSRPNQSGREETVIQALVCCKCFRGLEYLRRQRPECLFAYGFPCEHFNIKKVKMLKGYQDDQKGCYHIVIGS